MTQGWEPGVQYNLNDVVVFQNHRYRIIQAHRSQGDWTPPVTPALWGRIPDVEGHQQQQCNPAPAPVKPPKQQCGTPAAPAKPQTQQPQQHPAPPPYQAPANQQHPSDNKHEQASSKHDSDSSDDEDGKKKKKKLSGGAIAAIIGGVAAGAALLGVGVAAYKHNKKKDMKEWLEDAQYHTQCVREKKTTSPVNWVLTDGKNIPQDAIAAGSESCGTPLYLARGFHNGSTTPGKASTKISSGACIGYGNKEIGLEKYEILVGDSRAVKWVSVNGKLNVKSLGIRPVEGGFDSDGSVLYVARGIVNGACHPGKASESMKAACIPYGGKEQECHSYEILCYN